MQSVFKTGGPNTPAYGIMWHKDVAASEVSKSASARAATQKIRQIQGILREYGNELVAEGVLAQ